MKKTNMLKKNKDFSYCYRRGKKIHNGIFTLYFVTSKYNKRAGFTVSKKVGNAVVRNKVRRRLKEAFALVLPQVKGNCSVIFVATPKITQENFWDIHAKMEKSLEKAMLINCHSKQL